MKKQSTYSSESSESSESSDSSDSSDASLSPALSQQKATAKRALRKTHRQARRDLDVNTQYNHAERLMHNVLRTHLLLRYQRFALYLAADGEIDPAPLTSKLLEFSKQAALPCLRRSAYNTAGKRTALRMHFAACTQTTPLFVGAYNLTEPAAPARPPTFTAEVIFQPLVAFDRSGARLGMGGGFYDRYNTRAALRIGLAHAQQEVAELPVDAWDIPLDAVITERDVLPFNKRAATLLLGATH